MIRRILFIRGKFDKESNRELFWWGWKKCKMYMSMYWLYCYSVCILKFLYIHWHEGTNPKGWPLRKFYPNFRLRNCIIMIGKKKFKLPFKYYEI